MRHCKTCDRLTDDLYQVNNWLVCYTCVRGRPFWEMLRASWASLPAETSARAAS